MKVKSEYYQRWNSLLFSFGAVILTGCYASATFVISSPVNAQIVPDNTLPINSSVAPGCTACTIEGGTVRGSNLFHSFNEFSVPTSGEAFFNNAALIQNIFARVTGNLVSNIDGLMRANGIANVFLLNPNGIIFGKNAALNIGGSFLASTAKTINFADGTEFSAITQQAVPLLTISVPIGLQYGVNPRRIEVKGDSQGRRTTQELIDTTNALRVPATKTLALVGGDISLQGATLKTAGGRIELGSVKDNSFVSLLPISKGFALSYDGVQNFGNIQLSQLSSVDASGNASGDIQVQGRRITLSDGSGIETSTLGAEKGGNLVINATESLELFGRSADGQFFTGLFADTRSTGDAGDLKINTQNLLVQDGAQVSASTSGSGRSGFLTVTANDVQIMGTSVDGSSVSALYVLASSTGDAGKLTINTQKLLVQDGGQVIAGTISQGQGGFLTVNANDVQLISESADGQFPSGLFTSTYSSGNAGDLKINTQRLLVQDGAEVSASTFGRGKGGSLTVTAKDVQVIGQSADSQFPGGLFAQTQSTGDAGNLTINTQQLLVKDGAQVSAGTLGAGKGGSLTVTADDVQVVGTSANGQTKSGLFAVAGLGSTGNAGDLTISTDKLLVQDGAIVTVKSITEGIAGNLIINANSIRLNNNATIDANTQAVNTDPNIEQATINLRSRELILLRSSNITTNAFGENVIGGNINIDTDVLVAFDDSDISANSTDFRGGNVRIAAEAIIGTQFRNAPTSNSDITATGANPQFNGNVQINAPDVDPSQGLTTLPTNIIDTSQLIANSCIARSKRPEGKFIITGNGGSPVMPDDPAVASYQTYQIPTVTSASISTPQENTATDNKHELLTPAPLIEAKGWIYGSDGEVILTASAPTVAPDAPWSQLPTCSGS
ncbi:S-layer family protein [Nostoc sp. UHCC 0302]|uniref:S-layer family protein n=1 Tax=Nostoc sp. UHCC 0302 TaxID=3134896 RepID=UPI00311CC64B